MQILELTLVGAISAGLGFWGRGRWLSPEAGPVWLRGLGSLVSMGLAMLGAVLLVLGSSVFWGTTLSVVGCGLAILAVWGGDLLWQGRRMLTLAAGLGCLVGTLLEPSLAVFWFLTALLCAQGSWLMGNGEARGRLGWLFGHTHLWMGLLSLAVLIRIPVPLWPEGFPLIGTLQIALISLAALLWGWEKVGPRVLGLAILAFAIGLGVELLGSRTGFPFGQYSYAGAPGITLWSVPLIVPLGWFAMALAAHVLAGGRHWLAGLAMVAWDLGLEPLMTSRGFWQWSDPQPLWYGAPVQNFLAWFLVGAAISWIYGRLAPKLHHDHSFGWAYKLEALFIPAGLALFGLWQAALICGVAMNLVAWRDLHWPQRHPHPAKAIH